MADHHMVGDSFRLGYRFQRYWGAAMACAFFCGELGGGLFFVSMIFKNPLGLVLGLLIAVLGKSAFHLTHMGVPGKAWRAILRPDRSWISRGLIAIVVFTGAGAGHAINLIWNDVIPFGVAIEVLAGAGAIVVMTYNGFSMSHSTAIALWSTAMMPVLSLIYALTSGMAAILSLPSASYLTGEEPPLLPLMQGLLVADLLIVLGFVYAAYNGSAGAKLSAQLIIRTRYAYWFWAVVVATGLVLPLALLSLGDGLEVVRFGVVVAVLSGFYVFRILIFKAGVYEPVLPLARQ